MEEIERIYYKSLLPRLEQVRDVYLFCCFTGLAFTDVMQLTANNIITGIGGEEWIITERQKTGALEEVPLLPLALEILEKYRCNAVLQNKNQLPPCVAISDLMATKTSRWFMVLLLCATHQKWWSMEVNWVKTILPLEYRNNWGLKVYRKESKSCWIKKVICICKGYSYSRKCGEPAFLYLWQWL